MYTQRISKGNLEMQFTTYGHMVHVAQVYVYKASMIYYHNLEIKKYMFQIS